MSSFPLEIVNPPRSARNTVQEKMAGRPQEGAKPQ